MVCEGYVIYNSAFDQFYSAPGYYIWHKDLNRARIYPSESKALNHLKGVKNLSDYTVKKVKIILEDC